MVERATAEALAHARLEIGTHGCPHERVATVVGTSKGDLAGLGAWRLALADRKGLAGRFEATWPGGVAAAMAARFGARGPSVAPVAACATGVVAVLRAADLVREGTCDVALAGAGDASLEPLVLAAFRRMGALARIDPALGPGAAVRPLDRRRSGFLPGEGAAVLVLERTEDARARGVTAIAELAGGVLGSDAYHLTDLDPDPTNLAGLIERALADAGLEAADIGHVNLHGTATRGNDPLECRAVRRALGRHAGGVACCASKAQLGHTLGAAGAIELALACLAIRDGVVPPTLNHDDPDPDCDLDVAPAARSRPIAAALKLSLGFGGHLAVAALRRP
jgi:3-oxoacyl-[acyl-carrier-protein] synthase II